MESITPTTYFEILERFLNGSVVHYSSFLLKPSVTQCQISQNDVCDIYAREGKKDLIS